jgi:ribosomal protein L23
VDITKDELNKTLIKWEIRVIHGVKGEKFNVKIYKKKADKKEKFTKAGITTKSTREYSKTVIYLSENTPNFPNDGDVLTVDTSILGRINEVCHLLRSINTI